jgi:parallel beta-helix repeat protein
MIVATFLSWFKKPSRPYTKPKPRRAQPRFEVLEDRAVPAVVTVGPGLQYTTIQAGVNAATSGETVLVEPGTYIGQVVINKSITLEAAHTDYYHGYGWGPLSYDNNSASDWNNDYCDNNNDSGVIIMAPTTLGAASGSNPDAIVRVTGSGVVATIEHFTIEGASSTGTANLLFGVRVDGGATGEIEDNVITNIIDSSNVSLGVAVDFGSSAQASDGTGTQVGGGDVYHNTITNYNRAGVVVTNAQSWADINDNLIVAAKTQAASQTGVEVSFDAAANIDDNDISGNYNDSNGSGIDLYEPGAVTVPDPCNHQTWQSDCGYQGNQVFVTAIANNVITGNDLGIFGIDVTAVTTGSGWCQQTLGVSIAGNSITGNTYNGIWLVNSTGVTITCNFISGNGSLSDPDDGDGGIALTGNPAGPGSTGCTNISILNNTSSNNLGSGVYIDATSTGNLIEGNFLDGNLYSVAAQSADGVDLSIGNGTGGTANTWSSNTGQNSITVESGTDNLFKKPPQTFGGCGW